MSAGYMRRCARKQRHENRQQANAARKALVASKGLAMDAMNVYRCDQCTGWHVGGTSGQFITRNRDGKRPNKRMRGRQ